MSDFDRLKEMLRRSARDGSVPSDRVDYAGAPAGVARVLEQVDAAVLGQRLGFDFDDASRLVCEATGRRLVRLLAPAPPGVTDEQAALFDRDDLGAEDVRVLADLLVGLCERGSGFAMTAEPLGDGIGPAHGGVEPAAIAAAAGVPGEALFRAGEDPSHEAFLEALEPTLQAVLLVEGDEASLIRGEGDAAAFIVDWANHSLDNLLSPDFPLLGTLETNGILVFALPEKAGCHLLIAGQRGSLVVATVEGGDVAATLGRWRALNLDPAD